VDEERAVSLEHQEPHSFRQMGRQPARIRDFAAGEDETHCPRTVVSRSDVSRTIEDDVASGASTDQQWERILRGDGAIAVAVRLNRRLFALFPSPWRCKSCNAPFKGPASGTFRWIGYSPSAKNPSVCARCIERAPNGGAVVPLSVLMADLRGYTKMTEGLSPTQVPEAVNRFYETSSKALLSAEAPLGQIEGDLVMGLFVPGLAGRQYRRKAVEGATGLLRAIDWVGIGVGIASGEEFVGNVGGGGFKDFTALGDVTNVAARLTAKAAPGEILVDAATYAAVAALHPLAERRELELKGKSAPVEAFALRVQ
jgi:adenylate cyclase